MARSALASLPLLLAVGCAKDQPSKEGPSSSTDSGTTSVPGGTLPTGNPAKRPNFVIFLADDVGVDMADAWGADTPAITPVFDQLASESVRFRSAYAAPVCTPTRAELLTGRYNHRYGLTAVQPYRADADGLADSEVTIPEALAAAGYTSAVVGKWHLGTDRHHGTRHALEAGFSYIRGAVGNLDYVGSSDGSDQTYYHWEKNTDGELAWTDEYATIDNANEAIGMIETLPEPWLLYVPFFAAHEPWHVPPDDLYTGTLDDSATVPEKFVADLEAMDHEMGRILEALGSRDDTYVVYAGDNGSPVPAVPAPAKKTAYEAGVHVPFTIKGPGIAPHDIEHLTHVVDIFPTVIELAGVERDDLELDGRSLVPALMDENAPAWHHTVYSGRARPPYSPTPNVAARMIRDTDWKLIERLDSGVWRTEFYDMRGVEVEGEDLLAAGPLSSDAQTAYDALAAEFDTLLAGQPRP